MSRYGWLCLSSLFNLTVNPTGRDGSSAIGTFFNGRPFAVETDTSFNSPSPSLGSFGIDLSGLVEPRNVKPCIDKPAEKGVCDSAACFFTRPKARRLAKHFLRLFFFFLQICFFYPPSPDLTRVISRLLDFFLTRLFLAHLPLPNPLHIVTGSEMPRKYLLEAFERRET